MSWSNFLMPFALTMIAGLCTGIGSLIAFFSKKTNYKLLSWALGFSAGMMIFISFADLYPEAQEFIRTSYNEKITSWITAGAFFIGVIASALIDQLVPEQENPHEPQTAENVQKETKSCHKLMRTGICVAIAIAVHNFPEGLATFTSSLIKPDLGILIALTIAIHNIPEGIAVSIPIYQATCDRKKAVKYGFLSGLTEPLGALLGFTLLKPFINETVIGILLATVSGIMVFISIDELLPLSREYDEHHYTAIGFTSGMFIASVSILLLH